MTNHSVALAVAASTAYMSKLEACELLLLSRGMPDVHSRLRTMKWLGTRLGTFACIRRRECEPYMRTPSINQRKHDRQNRFACR